jgi:hypothetical protein
LAPLAERARFSQVTVGKQFAKGGTGLVSRATLVEEALGHTQVPVQ